MNGGLSLTIFMRTIDLAPVVDLWLGAQSKKPDANAINLICRLPL